MTQDIHIERIKVDALCANRDNPHGPLFRLEATADHQPPCASTRLPEGNGKRNNDHSNVLVSVVMPCLNEARTLAACVQQAHAGCRAALSSRERALLAPVAGRVAGGEKPFAGVVAVNSTYEIIVADNGSTDDSSKIAVESPL